MYRYYALGMLALVYAVSYMDRQIISILLDDLKAEFLLTDTQLGLLSGLAFAIFYATLGLPIARLADRSNRVGIISIAAAIWSAITALTATVSSFTQLLIARIGVGVGEAGAGPASHAVISDYFEPHERPLALSLYSTGVIIGALFGLVIGGLVAENYGWRTTFVVAGVPGIFLAMLVWLTVKEPQRRAAETKAGSDDDIGFFAAVAELWQNKVYRYVNIGHLLAVSFAYSFTAWMPVLFLRQWEVGQAEVGQIVGLIFFLGGLPGMIFGGVLATKLSKLDRRWEAWVSALGCFLAIPLYFYGFSSTSMMSAALILGIGGFFYQCSHGPGMAVLQNSVNPKRRAFAAAFMFFCSNLVGLGLGPLTVGYISDMQLGADSAESLAIALKMMIFMLVPAFLAYFYGGVLWGRIIKDQEASAATTSAQTVE